MFRKVRKVVYTFFISSIPYFLVQTVVEKRQHQDFATLLLYYSNV